MPSPIAHLAAGYALYQSLRRLDVTRPDHVHAHGLFEWPGKRFYAIAVMSLAPDLDSIVGLISGNVGRFHNNATHSLVVGLGFALVVGTLVALRWRGGFRFWFLAALASYELHILLDYFTWGRGVMLFWPFTGQRFAFVWPLFYGFHWSVGLFSVRHLWTIVSELLFALAIVLVTHRLVHRAGGR